MKDVKAARLLSTWRSSKRKTVAVTKETYDELLYKVPPLFAGVEKDSGIVKFVTLDRHSAETYLKSEYNLHETFDDGLCRNTFGEPEDCNGPDLGGSGPSVAVPVATE